MVSGTDSPEDKIVVYSQGNFCINQRARYKDGGILVALNLVRADGNTSIEDFSYLPTWV
jgi:poly-gamma-glutamate synthesis protein (capsule biosynthesis protein)